MLAQSAILLSCEPRALSRLVGSSFGQPTYDIFNVSASVTVDCLVVGSGTARVPWQLAWPRQAFGRLQGIIDSAVLALAIVGDEAFPHPSVLETDFQKPKKVFVINLWGTVQMCQTFLPLCIKSKGMIVNHTSITSMLPVPFGSTHATSKAALAMYSAILRREVECFGVQVIDLKGGTVQNSITINRHSAHPILPEKSPCQTPKDLLGPILIQPKLKGTEMPPAESASLVTLNLLENTRPPPIILRGHYFILTKIASRLSFGWLDGLVKKSPKFDEVESVLKQMA
ncbi:hypothetical protein UVI_02000020 [Ustilaginoidea virens]|uniref:Uncharacterized protein n=1 Tax=Ustilaginoidea virens TaxID=1159556 RepID=A0A1B5L1C6_USTVR|nr:hypothetical protein UVI_02000020 [Ustilaginoidea virens]